MVLHTWTKPLSQIVEKAYQRTKNFDKLSFLYLASGSSDKLHRMQKIAESRGDAMSKFHNALYTGDVESRIAVMREVGLGKLLFPPKQIITKLIQLQCPWHM